MLDRFCEHCCFVIILFFSKADQNQFLLELKVIEDKRRYISFSALFLTQVANLFWLPAVLYTAECKFKMSSTTFVPSRWDKKVALLFLIS